MFPWIVFWSPHVTFPFGGAVNQKIEPDTQWFFDAIPPKAGNANIEKQAFAIASYGKQLGLLIKLLDDLAVQLPPTTEQGQEAHAKLKAIQNEVQKLKHTDTEQALANIEASLQQLKRHAPDKLTRVQNLLAETLEETASETR